uniref:CCHC-type domain-containing protein n=1 Tax=Nicotiana tabacum TaxID=4097 RepID=A0A1S4CI75_TOBAC|nr:PREDICTED: uncharacterized protein LOC107819126 [Nicotiana tabacum]
MAYLTKRFQKMIRRNGGIPKRGSSNNLRGYDLCHKCGKPGYFIKDCPPPQERSQALAACRDSFSESGEDDEQGDNSMMAVESETVEYDSIFALMAKSDDDEEDDEGAVKGSSQKWYMDSECSKHMTESTNDFISLKAPQ